MSEESKKNTLRRCLWCNTLEMPYEEGTKLLKKGEYDLMRLERDYHIDTNQCLSKKCYESQQDLGPDEFVRPEELKGMGIKYVSCETGELLNQNT